MPLLLPFADDLVPLLHELLQLPILTVLLLDGMIVHSLQEHLRSVSENFDGSQTTVGSVFGAAPLGVAFQGVLPVIAMILDVQLATVALHNEPNVLIGIYGI